MSRALFGTDGIRARFGEEPLTEPTVRKIGFALAAELAASTSSAAPLVAVGGDTRASTPALVEWISSGLEAGGVSTLQLGVLPTPAVAWWAQRAGASAGVAISASHNPAADNGIKLLDAHGFKWSTAAEAAFERRIGTVGTIPGTGSGARRSEPESAALYVRWLAGEAGDRLSLSGLRIALDCANGAASALAAPLFRALGAEATSCFDRPDGANINLGCGSTETAAIAATVAAGGFDFGFAFDGDADRCLLIDETGELRDGDALLFLWARELRERGDLTVPRIVATSMSNLGLERALSAAGVDVERCDVGDREVVATLRRHGLRLGGEQSGHLIDLHRSTTGDGLLTAAVVAAILARRREPVARALDGFRRFPQILLNVKGARKPALESLAAVTTAARAAEERLAGEGRLVLRYSGTEPLARIMIEGPDEETIRLLAGDIAAALRDEIGAPA
jgi:phosphoglucosamine mutase